MKHVVGIDVGSTYTKAVILSPDRKLLEKNAPYRIQIR